MSKSSICLLYTGGTIGMNKEPNGILRPPCNPESFRGVAPELEGHFDFVDLMNKDSTNMNPGDWTKIANAIYSRRNDGYKGFVVAHGTDKMGLNEERRQRRITEMMNTSFIGELD